MKNRCYRPEDVGYPFYGGRGIRVCKRWRESFVAFLVDVGHAPTVNHTIDRIDPRGHYEPGNVRWLPAKRQNRNRTDTIMLSHNGTRRPLADWADDLGVRGLVIHKRLQRGWTVSDAVTIPNLGNGRK